MVFSSRFVPLSEAKGMVIKMKENLTSEDKAMSLLAHLSILIPNMGILAPLIIWLVQKDKSKFLRFNCLQAIFFQLLFLGLTMLSIIIGAIIMIISLPGIAANPNTEPGTLFFISMALMFLFFPFWIIFTVYAIVAGVKSFQGKKIKYAIIGNIIEKRVYKSE